MKSISLFYRDGTSDKVYRAEIVPDGAEYRVNFQFGRRGTKLAEGTKTRIPVSLALAENIFAKLVAEKRGKGYTEEAGGTAAAIAQAKSVIQWRRLLRHNIKNQLATARIKRHDKPKRVARRSNNANGNLKAIQTEMMARRRELIDAQKKQGGGCGAIQLKSDNLLFCYNPNRQESRSNPLGEKFYVTGTMNGCPVIVNEFDIYAEAA